MSTCSKILVMRVPAKGIICLWPNAAARRCQAPIVLRFIEISSEQGTMYLVINVLNQRKLSTAALRSRNSDHALAELDWSLVALTMVQLFAIREQIELEQPPEQTSVSESLRAIRWAMDNWHQPARSKDKLTSRLQTAQKDSYQRSSSKTSRYRPGVKDKPSANKPLIKQATRKQKQAYRELKIAA